MSTTDLKELLVLSTVRAHPLHGYALAEALGAGLGWTVGLTRPTVYAILRRFVDRGWLEGEMVRDSRLPEREVYNVTEQGEAAYPELLRRCAEDSAEGTHPLTVVLAHLDDLDASTKRATLLALRAVREARLQALAAFPAHPGTAGVALSLLHEQVSCEQRVLSELLAVQG